MENENLNFFHGIFNAFGSVYSSIDKALYDQEKYLYWAQNGFFWYFLICWEIFCFSFNFDATVIGSRVGRRSMYPYLGGPCTKDCGKCIKDVNWEMLYILSQREDLSIWKHSKMTKSQPCFLKKLKVIGPTLLF